MPGDEGSRSALERLLLEGSDDDARRFFLLLRPPELADILEQIPDDSRTRVIRLMSAPLAAEVLREVDDVERGDILEDLSGREIAEIVPLLRSDDAADIIDLLSPDKAERTLQKLDHEDRKEIEDLLRYDEETAGGIMQTEVVTVSPDLSVGQAIQAVRDADIGDVGEIHEVFVVDDAGRLVGRISPADLLHEDSATSVRSVAETNPVSVPVTMDQEDIAELVREYDLVTVPVVDENRILVGQILHDDIADVLEEEATEDIARMAGANPAELSQMSVLDALRSRIPWLLPAFAGGLLVAALLGTAEEEFRSRKYLSFYLVVVVGMAGNVGTQNSALTVRALALGRVAWRVVTRQILIGVTLGAFFGTLLFGFVLWKEGNVPQSGLAALTCGVAICASMTCGALMGVSVPLIVDRLGGDPAIAASPFIQTANDVAGAGIVILTARALGLF